MLFAAIAKEVSPEVLEQINMHYDLFRVCLVTSVLAVLPPYFLPIKRFFLF